MLKPIFAPDPQLHNLNSSDAVNTWRELLHLGISTEYKTGSLLFRQGAPADEMFLLERGMVKVVSAHDDGTEAISDLRYPGQWLDQCATLVEPHYVVSCNALTMCRVYSCAVKHFKDVVGWSAKASNLLSRQYAIDCRDHSAMAVAMRTRPAWQRLAYVLGRVVPRLGLKRARESTRIRLPLKDHDLASLIGVSQQHFSLIKRQLLKADLQITPGSHSTWIVASTATCFAAL